MTNATPSREDIVKHYVFDPEKLERVSYRKVNPPLTIVEPDPTWPAQFELLKARILAALGSGTALFVHHVGSTSVPGLPAKAIVDVDLGVADIADEASYAPQLEAAGFQFLAREPLWWNHRFFCWDGDRERGLCPAHLHVWPPDSPEVVRHGIMKEWLATHPDERELYARVKREAADRSSKEGETMMQYNLRKEQVIREILERAFRHKGYLP
ncbi:hypothetical protein S7711_04964 [Stachybotrys chartarum IBT 7711]|uniref:GrpB domain protein n=1 Tax=Stachybotrys chartarum (strain CBS 109288 / IBT 7711) TaxID=1280523 RepID=A0A084AR97_STACB|nr:hypothetical protein S7711_04964 [Stachybotrys chartarum IBT 7711]KFA47870.1 hypothetical protein S40293_05135 [Stachybotrys chartarum IBT 40293]